MMLPVFACLVYSLQPSTNSRELAVAVAVAQAEDVGVGHQEEWEGVEGGATPATTELRAECARRRCH